MTIKVLSAGAAKGLVGDLQAQFTAATGQQIEGTFSAVGAIREKFLAGEACDVLVLTAAQLAELAGQGLVVAETCAPIGLVRTGLGVPAGKPRPDVSTQAALAAAIRASRGIYMPDPERATAGIHFARVLQQLGVYEAAKPYLRPFPNGATAMRHMTEATEENAIGCTQITEIKYTPGLQLLGPLPEGCDLSTVYSAAVSAKAADPAAARRLAVLLTGAESRSLRSDSGFELQPD